MLKDNTYSGVNLLQGEVTAKKPSLTFNLRTNGLKVTSVPPPTAGQADCLQGQDRSAIIVASPMPKFYTNAVSVFGDSRYLNYQKRCGIWHLRRGGQSKSPPLEHRVDIPSKNIKIRTEIIATKKFLFRLLGTIATC
ncbi:hypothetical protein J6590_018402 [Homalodisca vitripennis]|nr:hypothetical protein J6590_018402 [Homalodisca vitripennis]